MNEQVRLEQAVARMPKLRVGEQLCLDFANTVEPRGVPQPVGGSFDVGSKHIRDHLETYDDLVGWGVYSGILTEAEAEVLLQEAARQPEQARATLARAIALRETIYRVFWTIAHDGVQDEDDLNLLMREQVEAVRHTALLAVEEGFAWVWQPESAPLERIIWPITESATSVLTTGDLARVKVCPGAPGESVSCSWLFYDTSKSRTRQWCSMDDCGGVAKARRQTARRRITRSRPN